MPGLDLSLPPLSTPVSENPISLLARPRQSSRVVSRRVSGEHILVPLASRGAEIDSIFNLNGTGSFIWERIDGEKTGEELANLVAEQFDVAGEQALADCTEFLSQLLEVRAIEYAAGE